MRRARLAGLLVSLAVVVASPRSARAESIQTAGDVSVLGEDPERADRSVSTDLAVRRDEMGSILSLNRRHRNFDPDAIESALESNPDAVPLSYYEHWRCLWCVAGELPAACRCPWDSVGFAGAFSTITAIMGAACVVALMLRGPLSRLAARAGVSL